jgi:hypothetical protein
MAEYGVEKILPNILKLEIQPERYEFAAFLALFGVILKRNLDTLFVQFQFYIMFVILKFTQEEIVINLSWYAPNFEIVFISMM